MASRMQRLWLLGSVLAVLLIVAPVGAEENGGKYQKQRSPFLELPSRAYIIPGVSDGIGVIEMVTYISMSDLNDVRRSIDFFRMRAIKRVEVILSTPGGDVFTAFAIVEIFEQAKRAGMLIVVRGYGQVLSAGTIIIQGASPGQRLLARNTVIMTHDLQIVKYHMSQYEQTAVRDEAMEGKKNEFLQAMYYRFFAGVTSRSIKEIAQQFMLERWMTPERAVELKLADEVI